MACHIKIDFEKAKSLKALYDYCGTNCSQFYSYVTTVIENINSDGELTFTSKFKESWKSKNPLDINTTPPEELKDAIIKYFNKKYPSVRDGVRKLREFDKVRDFGYTSVGAREEAKRHFFNQMITAYHKNENLGKAKVTTNLKAYYVQYAMQILSRTLARRLSKIVGIDEKTIYANFKSNDIQYVRNLLVGHESQVNLQLENLIALYHEFSSDRLEGETKTDVNPLLEFIDEVLTDSRLNEIKLDHPKTEDEITFELAQSEEQPDDSDGNPDDQTQDVEPDTYIYTLNNKMGITTTFMTHVGAPLRALLGSLPKMTTSEESDGKYVFDTDNYLGIPDVMDANLCATVLYHNGRYDNETEMMQSIKDIAERIPGFAAFSKLHDILESNHDLRLQFYNTFSKIPMEKLETVVKDGDSGTNISNSGINRQQVLKFRFINAVKSTSLSTVAKYNRKEAALIGAAIETFTKTQHSKSDGKELRNLCDRLAEQFKIYYPTIDEFSIRHYVLFNKNVNGTVNEADNLRALHTNLIQTIDGAEKTQANYKDRESAMFAASRHNAKIKKQIENNNEEVTSDDYIDMNPLYSQSYIHNTSEAAATQLAIMLVPYTLISNPLNSRNVNGNQSSDVINSSMMTNIRNILQSQLNSYKEVVENGVKKRIWDKDAPIVKLGEHRFQSKQYDFSNILLERRNEKGDIINYGLFYEDINPDGRVVYVPTDYSTTLLQIRLFDGASNIDDNANALYAKMSRGDYIGTAWRNFFKSKNSADKIDKVADYFMRIPSDAPKTFVITAPRYSATGFLKETNKVQIDENITKFIEGVSDKTLDVINSSKFNDYPIVVAKHARGLNLSSFVEHLQTTAEKTVDIKIPLNRQRNLKEDKTKKIRVAFRYAATNGDKKGDNVYIMEGTYYKGILHGAQFVGFKKDSVDDTIWTDVRSGIWNNLYKMGSAKGGIEYDINSNHPLFKQLVNVFTQELTDMVTASSIMFEKTKDNDNRENYRIKVDDNSKPIIIKNSDVIKNENEFNGLHPTYHFNSNSYHVDKGNSRIEKVTEKSFIQPVYTPALDANGNVRKTKEGETIYIKTDKYQCSGKVFSSDRFILYDYSSKDGKQPIRNYGQEILDEAFALFRTRTTDPNLVLQFDENGNIKLTNEQKEVIERHLKEFVLDYVEHARHRMQEYNSFVSDIPDAEVNTINLAEFVVNTHLMHISFNDLFEGDTKFYKNSQTFLKRAKEAQGSGVPYGVVDFTRAIQPGHNKIDSPLDTRTFIHKTAKGTQTYNVTQYDTFSAITIYNTVRTDVPMLETLVSTLTNKEVMGEKVLTEDNARQLLYGPIKKDKNGNPIIKNGQVVREGGYQDTTVNDAQSYITFPEWIRRITARGQLPKYKELIDRILDETTPLSVEDIQAFVQVQKNFYYDQYYNEKTKTITPRQIKNAEFVLVPRLIAGTELEKVAKMMDKLGVDQLNTVETSKAGQSERFTLWDSDGHISQDILDDIDNPGKDYKSDIMINGANAKEYYNYNYLYTQQETPQHINAENKAGIQVMKKILDNIDENSPKELQEAKEEFFNLYSANIKSSFDKLMQRFGVETDADGNIIIEPNGRIKGLNYKEFFDALKQELTRLGLDSNMVDYCTQDPHSPDPAQTIMPNYMSLIASKFENIVQSLFNNAITRQTLPGFHTAQITGMGFRKLNEQVDRRMTSNILQYHPQLYKKKDSEVEITEREYNLLSDEDKKDYSKSKVAGYVEVMLPASNFGFDRKSKFANAIRERSLAEGKTLKDAEKEVDDAFLAQLRNAKADEIIGYRIPTEGKQSVCCMKVVGFTDDAYGSTIVVPDAWVSQTGSDFDIDSVYGIQYSIHFDKKGNLKRTPYIADKKELYKKYVLRNLSEDEVNRAFEEAKAPQGQVDEIKAALRENKNLSKDEYSELLYEELKSYSKEAIFGVLEDIAEEKGLQSFEDYSKKDVEELNSTAARNNKLLDNIKFILTHAASLEENLSRSNFDDIIASLEKYNVGDSNLQRKARSPYNIFDQAEYQEDAMSGARLKAFSVVRDTLCSICNTLKPTLENNSEIRVFYSSDNYDEETLKKRFGNNNVHPSTGGFIVTHRTFGWTNDNKNVEGKILTAYSSQTTAHILDAIKSGNVPNVNDLTFQVYKTIVDVGSNYDTAISFIRQPGIRRIVDAYNATNSIYSEEKGRNYVLQAVRSILDDLGLEYEYNQSLDDLLAIVNSNYGDVASELFKDKNFEFSVADEDNAKLALNSETQLARLSEEGMFSDTTPVEEMPANTTARELRLLYDLQTILQYNKIDNLANNVRDAARVLNPDKFGAKQTIFATRQVFDNIVRSIQDNLYPDGTNFRLQVKGKHLLSVVYPGLEDVENGDEALNAVITNPNFVKDSKYKPLAAFLKYATATSIRINKTLFATQSDEFLDMIVNDRIGLESKLSNGNHVTEKMAKDFQNYIVNYVVMKSEFLRTKLVYNCGAGGQRGFEYIGKVPQNEAEAKDMFEKESIRVFGYGHPVGLVVKKEVKNEEGEDVTITEPFRVVDVNNPTQDEVNDFNEMSPAQKVTWIRRHFRDAGVFSYIDTQLFNEYSTRGRKAGTQTMTFDEQAADIETVRREFEEAFTHTNPLIASAAADIVKYAFFVEGYRMGMGNVSKMIKNSVLLNGGRIRGTNIVNNTNVEMRNIDNIAIEERENLIQNFIRSHATSAGIHFHNVVRNNKSGYELALRSHNLIQINGSTNEGKALAEKYGVIYKDKDGITIKTNSYVRLGFGKKRILYKIKPVRVSSSLINYFLIPLNELEANENAEWSANATNHVNRNEQFYNELIENYISRVSQMADGGNEYHSDVMREEVKSLDEHMQDYVSPYNFKQTEKQAKPLPNLSNDPRFSGFIDEVTDWFKTSIEKGQPTKYIWYSPFDKYIVNFDSNYGSGQKLTLKDGTVQNFRIYKVYIKEFAKKYTGRHIDDPIAAEDRNYTELIEIIRKVASHHPDNEISFKYPSIYAVEATDMDMSDDDDGLYFSTIYDVAVQNTASIYRRSHNVEDDRAGRIAQNWREKGIRAKQAGKGNVESYMVNANMDDIIINAAKYLDETVNDIESRLRHFIKDPDSDKYLAVDDIKCINIVKKNPLKRREYLKLLLEPNAIVDEFGLIKELDIESTDPQMQQYLTKIKKAVERMQNLPLVANAYEKFAEGYYDKLTDNPLVRQGMLSVLDGFYKTNWANAMFNDIQETSNPIIQIAMKNFQADLRAKQFAAREKADEFIKHVDELKEEARKHGETFDLSHIIDDIGRFKLPHNQKFIDDRDRLKRNTDDLKAKMQKYALGTPERTNATLDWLKAKLEYDEWKAIHVQQEVVPEFYIEKNKLLRSMLYPDTSKMTQQEVEFSGVNLYAKQLAKYEALRLERSKVRNKFQTDAANPELDREIDRLNEAIYSLQYANDGDDEAMQYAKKKLHSYVRELQALYNKYYRYDPVYNFESLVEENRKIVESFQLSGKPANLYIDNPDYVKAKTWLIRNVDIEPVYDEHENVKGKLEEAYAVLKSVEKTDKYRALRKERAYRNKNGDFDPRLIPDEEIEKLRDVQAGVYKLSDERPFSDKTLIGNRNPDGTIYTQKFYKGMYDSSSNGDNPAWQKLVTQINDLISPFYNFHTKEIDLESIPHDEDKLIQIYGKEVVDDLKLKHNTTADVALLREFRALYNDLHEIRGTKKSAATKKFIKENVEFANNTEKYNADVLWAQGLPKGDFRSAVFSLIRDISYDGNDTVPNSFLYGFAKPKANKLDEYTDKARTEALKTIEKYKEKRLIPLYYEAKYEARHNKSDAEYNAWIARNHVYNPYTHSYEPVAVWWETKDKADKFDYYPKFPQQVRIVRDGKYSHKEATEQLENFDEEEFPTVRDLENHYFKEMDYRNKNYDPAGGHSGNYIKGSSAEYDNNFEANKYELEAMKYMEDTLLALANTQDSERYLKNKWLPARNRERPNDVRGWVKEILKTFGWTNETYNPDDWYDDVDYSKDRPNPMPMLERLKGKGYKDVPPYPKKKDEQSEEDYAADVAKWEKDKADIEKINLEVHKALLDKDWVNVIADFIVRAGTYNAIQENKYELFYAQQLLKKYGTYVTAYSKNGNRRFKKNVRNSNETEAEYLRRQDKYLIEQFNNQLRRILYNQFKTPNPPKLMKWMSTLQSLTSAQYMMLNVKGGIANVTLGESQIAAEAFAREFFDLKTYAKGKLFYNGGVYDYILHSNDDKSGTVQNAIIKFMDVVDYDEHTGVSRLTKDAYEALKKIRNWGYTPQTAGEHGMQNSAMFTMMMSHRLYLNEKRDELGQPKYIYKNLAEAIRDTHEKALKTILSDEEITQYENYKKQVSSDANEFKEFAWYQKDVTSQFAREHLDIDRRREWVKTRKELQEKVKEEFNDDTKHPTILSQLTLGENGKMAFNKDSMLAEIDVPKDNGEPSDALRLLADFKGRVIAVNKYIHGAYDKSGRAQFEKTFIGSLFMQYHKHLPIGIMKRYRLQGMYSEERGAVAKGMYRSLFDYLSIPFRKHQRVLNLTDEQVDAAEGVQNVFKNILDFVLHFKLAYREMPEYDRANIRRMKGDIYGVLAAVALTIVVKAGADDDDEDGLLYNLALYEADRLATEAAQYVPFVAYTEAKKLWQSPIAAGSGVTDLLSSMNLLAHMITDGEDFDGEYHSGKFAGESKLKVYIERRIPLWRGIRSSFIDIKTNNHFYKIGDNMLNFIDTEKYANIIAGRN